MVGGIVHVRTVEQPFALEGLEKQQAVRISGQTCSGWLVAIPMPLPFMVTP